MGEKVGKCIKYISELKRWGNSTDKGLKLCEETEVMNSLVTEAAVFKGVSIHSLSPMITVAFTSKLVITSIHSDDAKPLW